MDTIKIFFTPIFTTFLSNRSKIPILRILLKKCAKISHMSDIHVVVIVKIVLEMLGQVSLWVTKISDRIVYIFLEVIFNLNFDLC